jgi:hypothetical protein
MRTGGGFGLGFGAGFGFVLPIVPPCIAQQPPQQQHRQQQQRQRAAATFTVPAMAAVTRVLTAMPAVDVRHPYLLRSRRTHRAPNLGRGGLFVHFGHKPNRFAVEPPTRPVPLQRRHRVYGRRHRSAAYTAAAQAAAMAKIASPFIPRPGRVRATAPGLRKQLLP